MRNLRVLILKPSKYGVDGLVERYRRGFMPNATIPYLRSMTPREIDGCSIETHMIDEYVQTDLSYLRQLERSDNPTLLALAGVQSHQFQRALDLAAYALDRGNKCPDTNPLLNFLLNLRANGFRFRARPNPWRHPRQRIFHALVLLLWAPAAFTDPRLRHRLVTELNLRADSLDGWLPAYRALWSRVR